MAGTRVTDAVALEILSLTAMARTSMTLSLSGSAIPDPAQSGESRAGSVPSRVYRISHPASAVTESGASGLAPVPWPKTGAAGALMPQVRL